MAQRLTGCMDWSGEWFVEKFAIIVDQLSDIKYNYSVKLLKNHSGLHKMLNKLCIMGALMEVVGWEKILQMT